MTGNSVRMDNGFGTLADEFHALDVSDPSASSNDSLFQVKKAVEAAEATIRQQVAENERLRIELQRKTQEFEKYKSDGSAIRLVSLKDDLVNQTGPKSPTLDCAEGVAGNNMMNDTLKILPSDRDFMDRTPLTLRSSLSTTSIAPNRYQIEGEFNRCYNSSKYGIMPTADANNSGSFWKQDLFLKNQEYEEEIARLRKQLAEFSVREAQINNEKFVLEKRISYMRMAFDQQQRDLVDTASKSLSYRQDIIEENIRLTYALQDAHQERTTFASSLLNLLSEYSLQPQIADAQSIISNLKVLFKHLQEKLLVSERKLKDSHHQLAPWGSDAVQSDFVPSSPSISVSAALATSRKNGLELVPRPTCSLGKTPLQTSNIHTATEWDPLGPYQSSAGGFMATNLEIDELGRYSPLANRNSTVHDVHSQLAGNQLDSRETANKQVTFSDPVSTSEMDDPDMKRQPIDRELSTNWVPRNTTLDDANSSAPPYLAPVLEEPSPSFSEDDDPLPAIENLQISGEAFPGCELQACGFSTNGTTSCNFEWVRHLENGSVNYIEGAKQPKYLVTADDVDAYLAIEVQPLDDRKRKGELVKVFANEHRKITCHPEMQRQIEKVLYTGHASYKLSLSTGYLDIWELATLSIKSEGYSIKRSAPSGLGVTEKFSSLLKVLIPYGNPSEFSIISSGGVENLLQADNSTDISCARDTIVLTMRLFIRRAVEKKRVKKKSLFSIK